MNKAEVINSLENLCILVNDWYYHNGKNIDDFLVTHEDYLLNILAIEENWIVWTSSNYFLAKTFCYPVTLKKFRKSVQNKLSEEELSMLSHCQKNPPVWGIIKTDKIEDRIIYTTDLVTGEKRKVLLKKDFKSKKKIQEFKKYYYLCLLFPYEDYWITNSYVFDFLSFSKDYFLEALNIIDPNYFDTKGLTAFINKHYSKIFLILEDFTDPDSSIPENGVEYCWTELYLKGFDPKDYTEVLFVEKSSKEILCLKFKEQKLRNYIYLLFNIKTEEALLLTLNQKAYKILVETLGRDYELSKHPEHRLSSSLHRVLETDLRILVPPTEWFGKIPETKKDKELKEKIEKLIFKMRDPFYKDYDFEAEAIEIGIPRDSFEYLTRLVEREKHRGSYILGGGFDEPLPEVTDWRYFRLPLKDSLLFSFNKGPDSYKHFLDWSNKECTDDDYVHLIKILQKKFNFIFGEYSNYILNCIFYFLLNKKNEWLLPYDYAIEILKMFGDDIISADYSLDMFFEEFTKSIIEVLIPFGFIQTRKATSSKKDKRGLYEIKPTDFFNSYVNLIEEGENL